MTPIQLIIPLAPRTKKNGSRIVGMRGRPRLLPSKAWSEYQNDAVMLIPTVARRSLSVPVNVKATYYLDANRRTDMAGLNQGLHDLLVAACVLADDSAVNPCIIAGTDGSRVYVDRKNPRTEVEITLMEHDPLAV